MKLMIMLLISLLLATGVEAGPDVGSHANCVKKFDKCVKKHWKKNCPSPSPSPPAAPPSPFVAFTFTSKDSLLEAVKDFNKKPGEAEKKYGPIATWDVSGITDMSYLFDIPEISDTGAETTINADISDWDTSGVTNMVGMFLNAKAFNQPLSFDTSSVINMRGMFAGADAFNQPLSFDTSSVTMMDYMFNFAPGTMSAANKLSIRCAWTGNSALASAGYDSTWAPGSCSLF